MDGALAPAVLLAVECGDARREFCGTFDGGVVDELPALHLGAVGEVYIFGEGVVLPAACIDDALAAPDSCGAVKVEPAACAIAGGVFYDEVTIEEDGLATGEGGVGAVEVAPASLDHADLWIFKVADDLTEYVCGWDEVRIEYGDEVAFGVWHCFFECACLEACAAGTVAEVDVVAFIAHFPADLFTYLCAVIG